MRRDPGQYRSAPGFLLKSPWGFWELTRGPDLLDLGPWLYGLDPELLENQPAVLVNPGQREVLQKKPCASSKSTRGPIYLRIGPGFHSLAPGISNSLYFKPLILFYPYLLRFNSDLNDS